MALSPKISLLMPLCLLLLSFSACEGQLSKHRESRTQSTVDDGESLEPSTESGLSWQQQLEKVRSGEISSIELTEPAEDELLHQLLDVGENLLELKLDAGGVDDEWLSVIGTLPVLEHLRIRQSNISDAGIGLLCEGGKKLKILNLPQAKLTAEGIEQLNKLPDLIQLRLGGDQLDNRAAEAFAGLSGLRSLHLIGPRITAEGLLSLANCPRLSSLYIDDCPLPDAAWQGLFTAKPNLHVHIDQVHHDRDPNAHAH